MYAPEDIQTVTSHMNISGVLTKARVLLNLSQQEIADIAEVSLSIVVLCEDEAMDFEGLTQAEKTEFRKVVAAVKCLCQRKFIVDDELH